MYKDNYLENSTSSKLEKFTVNWYMCITMQVKIK